MIKPYIVGISGGSASGKTLFFERLQESLKGKEITYISLDNYYRPIDEQPKDSNGIENFDTPESIDQVAILNDLKELSNGRAVEKSVYTFNNPNHEGGTVYFKPAPLIILEGIFVYYYPELNTLLDLKIFLEAPEPTKINRRILRDQKERGYDLQDVLYRYENHVFPNYQKYIKPLKYDADLIIPNNSSFDKALQVVISHLNTLI